MGKFFIKLLAFLFLIPVLVLVLFNMGSGVDCSKHIDSGSCLIGNSLKNIFYFPECKEAMERYRLNEQKNAEAKKQGGLNQSNTGPFNPYSQSPMTPFKCGMHDYFHPADQGQTS